MKEDDKKSMLLFTGTSLWLLGIVLLYTESNLPSLVVESCFFVFSLLVLLGRVGRNYVASNKYMRLSWWLLLLTMLNPLLLRVSIFAYDSTVNAGAQNAIFLFMSFVGVLLVGSLFIPLLVVPLMCIGQNKSGVEGKVFTVVISFLSTYYNFFCYNMIS